MTWHIQPHTFTSAERGALMRRTGISELEAAAALHLIQGEVSAWSNDTYKVIVNLGDRDMIILLVTRHDKAPCGWQELQIIKNELVGPEAEAVQLFPAESRLINLKNQYHLWVLRDNKRFPFGLDVGREVFNG